MTQSGLRGRRICLVTSGPLSSSPRVVKEADALAAAGAHTAVVGLQTLPSLRASDQALAADRGWRWRAPDVSREAGAWRYSVRAVRERALQMLPPALWVLPGIAEGAFSRLTAVLEAELALEPAELYIAHNLAALPAAASAARRCGARLGFDAEDYHAGELPDAPENEIARQRVLALEDRYLPRCEHLTAASPEIAERYARRLGRKVVPLLNVFPLAERPAGSPPAAPQPPSLYWFSQTIGPGRGLEPMIDVLALLKTRPLLQIRGTFTGDFRERLLAAAARAGVAEQLRFLPRAAPGEMVALAAEHSVGLSLELAQPENRALCLTNKIFTCLLAGLPVLLNDTPAQRRLAPELGDAARLVNLADAGGAARALGEWLGSADRLAAARASAWRLGQERYNWDREQAQFLSSVSAALGADA